MFCFVVESFHCVPHVITSQPGHPLDMGIVKCIPTHFPHESLLKNKSRRQPIWQYAEREIYSDQTSSPTSHIATLTSSPSH